MAENSARNSLREAVSEFVRLKQREFERFGQDAEAVAREAYNRALRAREDLIRRAPGLLQYGANPGRAQARPVIRSRPAPQNAASMNISPAPAGRAPTAAVGAPRNGGSENWLDHSVARALGGSAARKAGLLPGAARGAWRSVEGLAEGLSFLSRLGDPYDAHYSPRGEAAWDQVFNAGKGAVDYARNAISNPETIVEDVGEGLSRLRARIDPNATPAARTFGDEMRRNFDIGLNRGELLFDIGSTIYGGAAAKGLAGAGGVAKAGGAAKYLARGYPTGLSEYFATPYKGMGHHTLPRRTKLPPLLGGGPVPRKISDSPLFLLKPRDIETGDFYERHYQVDKSYGGGSIPKKHGGGRWSGEELGWKKYGPLGRVWYGSTTPMKAIAGSGVVGAGAAVDQIWTDEDLR